MGMKRIEVRVGDATARYALLEDAPKTADAFWESLPIEGTITHARWAGSAVWVKTPNQPIAALDDIELPVTSIYPGTIVVRPNPRGVAELFLSYGVAESRGPVGRTYATPVAELDGDGAELLAAFRATWRDGSTEVSISRAEDAS
ncbi:Protein of unknown function [Jiangella alkaliphila]|uniref:DUF3830 family protein n=2 Tax=Jiangella alkaliphila TaxID=419479 RepID=A0A1H2LCK3_9ACTN|nr:Protein of unknown function [Jiangella alkaliphila]